MAKFTARSYDQCATGAQDNSSCASATGAAAASVTATVAADANNFIYVTGFSITSSAPAATVGGAPTLTGLAGGTQTYQFVESATFGGNLQVTFADPIPTTAMNTQVQLVVPAITSGGAVSVNLYYYKRPE